MSISRRTFLAAVAGLLWMPADDEPLSYDDLLEYARTVRPPLSYYAE